MLSLAEALGALTAEDAAVDAKRVDEKVPPALDEHNAVWIPIYRDSQANHPSGEILMSFCFSPVDTNDLHVRFQKGLVAPGCIAVLLLVAYQTLERVFLLTYAC